MFKCNNYTAITFSVSQYHRDEAPVYLCELVHPHQPARARRSASSNSLEVKRTRIKAGDGSFVVAAASLWNILPNFIKTCDTLASFKCRLKTYLSYRKSAYVPDERNYDYSSNLIHDS